MIPPSKILSFLFIYFKINLKTYDSCKGQQFKFHNFQILLFEELILMTSNRSNFFAMTLVLVHSREQFDKIESEKPKGRLTSVFKYLEVPSYLATPQKHDIVIPMYGKIPNPQQVKAYRTRPRVQISNIGYIRLKAHHNLPSPFSYELTNQDLDALNHIKQKYTFADSTNFELEEKHMTLIFRWCEEISHSTDSQVLKIFSDEKTMSEHIAHSLEGNFDESEREKLSILVCELFQYWKVVKKDRFNEPLMRKFWPKENCKSQYFDHIVPYKSRSPGILDPIFIPMQLRMISKKQTREMPEESIKIISSFDQWKVLYKTHRKKKKEFQKMVKNFHLLIESDRFSYPLSIGKIWDTTFKETEIQKSRDLKDFQESNEQTSQHVSSQQRNIINRTEIHKLRQKNIKQNKSAEFLSVTQWIRYQKKMIRKQKNEIQSCENIYESYEPIEISDDDEKIDDVSVIETKQFYENAFLDFQKQLQEQEVFRFVVKEDENIDSNDESTPGSENFYEDLDFKNIPNEEDFFFDIEVQHDQKRNSKDEKQLNEDDQNSNNTTVYEDSSEELKKKKRPCPRKHRKKINLKKKVKKD